MRWRPHVIDDEQAIAGLELQRRLVLPGEWVVAHVQLFHVQLAAGDDDRAFAVQQPAVDAFVEHQVVRLAVVIQALVHLRIADLDHRLVDDNGMGHPDRLGEQPDQSAADVGFARARRAVDRNCPPGIQGDAQLVEHALAQHHACQGVIHVLGGNGGHGEWSGS